MKTIRFTQTHNLSVTVEALVPESWSDDDIYEFTKDCPSVVTVSAPSPEYLPDTVIIIGQELDGAEVTDAIIWN